jgi:hypothetical protein
LHHNRTLVQGKSTSTMKLLIHSLLLLAATWAPGVSADLRARRAKSGKEDKEEEVCIGEIGLLETSRGSAAASSATGVVGVATDPVDTVIGDRWTMNNPNPFEDSAALYDALGNSTTAITYKLTTEYASRGEGAACVSNGCSEIDCRDQKGYLQFFHDGLLANAAANPVNPLDLSTYINFYEWTNGITPISATDFNYFSYDIYPIDCGTEETQEGFCADSFYVSVRFVDKFASQLGDCTFYGCSFDYRFVDAGLGPEGEWTTLKITKDTKPERIRKGSSLLGSCECPLVASDATQLSPGISIQEALDDPTNGAAFSNYIVGTGLGEIAAINVGYRDYELKGCVDNAVFSTATGGNQVFDFEPSANNLF